jgi:hypothetical protein
LKIIPEKSTGTSNQLSKTFFFMILFSTKTFLSSKKSIPLVTITSYHPLSMFFG